MPPSKDYYELLGVRRDSSPHVIGAAYKALMRVYHPDVNKGRETPERASELSQAYATLRDPAKRAKYDQALRDEAAEKKATSLVPLSPGSEAGSRSSGGDPDLVPCPQCAEPIRRQAKLCRYCGWSANAAQPPKKRSFGRALDLVGLGAALMLAAVFVIGLVGTQNGATTENDAAVENGSDVAATENITDQPISDVNWMPPAQCRKIGINGPTSLARKQGIVIDVATGDDANLYEIDGADNCRRIHGTIVPLSPRELARQLGEEKERRTTTQVTLPENGTDEQDEAIINRALSQLNQE